MFQHLLLCATFIIGMVFAAPRPHIGMIDNDVARDVGAVFTEPTYNSSATFLLMNKINPECMPLAGDDIMSIQICIEAVDCDFFKSNDCGVGSGQKPVFTVGCGDVAEVPSRLVADYHSYKCQLALNHDIDEKVTVRIPTTPHDPNGIVPGMQSLPPLGLE